MFIKLVDTLPKLFIILLLSLGADWLVEELYEILVRKDVGIFTIVFVESFISLIICTLMLLIPFLRKQVLDGITKININDCIKFIIFTIIIIVLSMFINASLIHHDATTIIIIELIASLLFGGLVYFLFTKDIYDYKKILAYIFMVISSVAFTLM